MKCRWTVTVQYVGQKDHAAEAGRSTKMPLFLYVTAADARSAGISFSG
jgi:hypothetical protein